MPDKSFTFGEIRVDPAAFRVWRGDSPVPLEPKAIEILLALIERRDRLVTREELLDLAWKDTFVTPNALTRVIAQLRKGLGDDAQEARWIETVPRRGYRFIGTVEVSGGNGGSTEAPATGAARDVPASGTSPQPDQRLWPLLLAAAVIVLVAGLMTWAVLGRPTSTVQQTLRLGPATPVTAGVMVERDPAISPDGRFIAWSSSATGSMEVYVRSLAEDAREIAITSDGQQNIQPAWSPDGRYLAYQSSGRKGIWIVPVTGGPARQLTDFGWNPAWSPDGRRIAFDSNSGSIAAQSSLFVVDADGANLEALTRPGYPAGGHQDPGWAPNGRQVAFATYGSRAWGLWLLDLDSGTVTQLDGNTRTNGVVFDRRGEQVFWLARDASGVSRLLSRRTDPADSLPVGPVRELLRSDSSALDGLSLAGDRLAWSYVTLRGNLWQVPLQPGAGAAGAPRPLTETLFRATYPAFSPDGAHVAYVLMRPGAVSDIWTMAADGSGQAVLLSDDAMQFYPSWTPDGSRVLASIKSGGDHQLAWLDTRTRRRELLRAVDAEQNVRLSFDGATVAYHEEVDGILNVFTAPLAGGTPTRITADREGAAYPAWSPDGRRLAVEVKRGTDVHVAVVDAAGGPSRELTAGRGLNWPHSWAPDNDRIAFAGERAGVWNVFWVSASSGRIVQLTDFSDVTGFVRYPAWSPRDDAIVFERSDVRAAIYTAMLER